AHGTAARLAIFSSISPRPDFMSRPDVQKDIRRTFPGQFSFFPCPPPPPPLLRALLLHLRGLFALFKIWLGLRDGGKRNRPDEEISGGYGEVRIVRGLCLSPLRPSIHVRSTELSREIVALEK
ncbi:hypothetical protein GWI33_013069, partial [Rhynchophorus ferrugineus]